MQRDDAFLKSAVDAATARTREMAARFSLSIADREDLHQSLMLDLFERKSQYDPSKGAVGTFTGLVARHRALRWLDDSTKDRRRMHFISDFIAVEEADPDDASEFETGAALFLMSGDQDPFPLSDALHDLQAAIQYMNGEQRDLFDLLLTHEEMVEACRMSGLTKATFYRRIDELRMHLRMFGFKPDEMALDPS